VLTLIQILAYDSSARRTDEALRKQLSRKPRTAKSWTQLGREHPEFFRVFDPQGDSRQNESVTLVAQFVLPTVQKYDSTEAQTPALSAEVTNNLMNLAIELHDREMQRRDRWKIVLVPMIVAIVAAGATVTAAIITSSRHTADQQRITPLRPPDEHAA
jgi:hypothetical protein